MARPPKYRKEYCAALLEHMGKGGSMVAFCAAIGICRETFSEWTRRHKEFSDTYKKGVDLCEAYWEDVGRQAMTSGDKFNTALYCFYMKNRFRWRDAAAPEAAAPEKGGGGNTLVDVKNLILVSAGRSDEERERIVRGLEAAVLEDKNHKG